MGKDAFKLHCGITRQCRFTEEESDIQSNMQSGFFSEVGVLVMNDGRIPCLVIEDKRKSFDSNICNI